MARVLGLHHITGISGDAQANHDFYVGTLGMRLVKRSVNQDDPGTYHLFYADDAGSPGTDITFFPWTSMAPTRKGHGLTSEVLLAIPAGSLDAFWLAHLAAAGIETGPVETRRGERVVTFRDRHGLDLALAETADDRVFTPWAESVVPAEFQVRGLHGARVWERDLAPTATFLTGTLGLDALGDTAGDDGVAWHRFGLAGGANAEAGQSGSWIEVRVVPDAPKGVWGTGSIHHIAWRVADEAMHLDTRAAVEAAGRRPTPVIDRFWFKSVYFTEPGGVVFELATDGPGFAVDEDAAHLGETLVLPPWLEPHRADIEARLPRLTT